MHTILKQLSVIIFIISLVSCKQSKQQYFDYGQVDNNIYTNNYFDITMNTPKDWVIQHKTQRDELMQSVIEQIDPNNQLEETIKVSEINTASLFVAFKYKLDNEMTFNPSIMIMAENIKNNPEIKNATDYLSYTQNTLKLMQINYQFDSDEFEKEVINSIEFYKMKTHIDVIENEVKQCYYTTIDKGFSISFIISYIDKEQEQTLLKSINSIKKR